LPLLLPLLLLSTTMRAIFSVEKNRLFSKPALKDNLSALNSSKITSSPIVSKLPSNVHVWMLDAALLKSPSAPGYAVDAGGDTDLHSKSPAVASISTPINAASSTASRLLANNVENRQKLSPQTAELDVVDAADTLLNLTVCCFFSFVFSFVRGFCCNRFNVLA
jgi:hypothetical protein